MKFSDHLLRTGTIGLMVLAVGCAMDPTTSTTGGNDQLGIAQFVVEENALRTSVVGLDAQGTEVARAALIHGVFRLTGMFRDEYDVDRVDGRKLDVRVNGRTFTWETEGYTPTLHMPAIPATEWRMAAFLADPHVKPVLAKWLVGFEETTAPSAGEQAYVSGSIPWGTDYQSCSGMTDCNWTARGLIGTCGNSSNNQPVATLSGERNRQGSGEVVVIQCCPANSGGISHPWFGEKRCPPLGTTSTVCGNVSGNSACKGCGAFETDYGCSTWADTGTYFGGESPLYYEYYDDNYAPVDPSEPSCTPDGGYAPAGYGWDSSCCSGGACEYQCGATC